MNAGVEEEMQNGNGHDNENTGANEKGIER
jgi:hypothetical protein